jgi:hypothetical protein
LTANEPAFVPHDPVKWLAFACLAASS